MPEVKSELMRFCAHQEGASEFLLYEKTFSQLVELNKDLWKKILGENGYQATIDEWVEIIPPPSRNMVQELYDRK